MKDLCNRARAAMNLILLFCLLQVWILSSANHLAEKVLEEVTQYGNMLSQHSANQPVDASTKEFIAAFNAAKSTGSIPSIKLSLILGTPDRAIADFYQNRLQEVWKAEEEQRAVEAEETRKKEELKAEMRRKDEIFVDDSFFKWPGKMRSAPQFDPLNYFDWAGVASDLKARILYSKLPLATATIADLQETYERQIELPFIKKEVTGKDAYGVLQIAMLAPLALVYVLLDSIWLKAESDLEESKYAREKSVVEPFDFILLYRSKWSLMMGFLWLLAPVVLTLGGMTDILNLRVGNYTGFLVVLAVALPSFVMIAIARRALQIRRTEYWGRS
jgi:hypothetical protein